MTTRKDILALAILLFPVSQAAAGSADGPAAFEQFILSSGTAYGLSEMADNGPLLLGEGRSAGGAILIISAEGRARLAEHARFLAGPEAEAREFEKLKALLSAQKLWDENIAEALSSGPAALNPEGKNILLRLIAAQDGKATASIKNRLLSLSPALAPEQRGMQPRTGTKTDWNAIDNTAKTGNFAPLAGYTVDREARTIRIMVYGKRPAAQEVLTRQDVTPEKEKAILAAAGLPADISAACGGQLVRAVGGWLFYDVPLGKTAVFAGKCGAAGLQARPVQVFRAR